LRTRHLACADLFSSTPLNQNDSYLLKNETPLYFPSPTIDEKDDLYGFLSTDDQTSNDQTSNDDVEPDGFLRLDYDNCSHDGVLYLTNDRQYVAADSHLYETPKPLDPVQPYVASDTHLTVTETDMDIYNTLVTPTVFRESTQVEDQIFTLPSHLTNLYKSNDWLFSQPGHLTSSMYTQPSSVFQLYEGQLMSPMISDSRSCSKAKLDYDRLNRYPDKKRSEYFNGPVRALQLQRYRDKKLRRIYHRAVDEKRSAQAKCRVRNARGRFVVSH